MGIVVLSFFVTTVLVFAVLYLLFRKYSSRKNPLSNVYYWLAAIVATPGFYIMFILIWFFVSSSYERKEFDKESWTNNRGSRYVYVEDLIEGEKLLGLTGNELKSMLGEADHEDDSTMTFFIGYSPEHFLNMDPDWLVTDLTDRKVSEAYVRE